MKIFAKRDKMNEYQDNVTSMHEVLPSEITMEDIEKYHKIIDETINKVKMPFQGWIVSPTMTDKYGNYTLKNEHITGYLINESDPRHGQLITTASIKNDSNMNRYDIVYTNGINDLPYFVLTGNEVEK